MNQTVSTRDSLLTRNFILVCLIALVGFGGMSLLMPTLPLYVLSIGGSTFDIGLVISTFAVVSIFLRPFTGRASDLYGSRKIMLVGGISTALASILYLWPLPMPWFLAVRIIHGAAISILGTGAFAYVAEIAPSRRRGEAMGLFGMAMSLSFATGPLLGSMIMSTSGFPALFLSLTVTAVVALFFIYLAKPIVRAVTEALPPINLGTLINKEALLPGILLFCMSTSFATMATLLPLFANERSLGDAGVYFAIQASIIFISRGFAGKLSDRHGRIAVIVPSLLLMSTGIATLGLATSPGMFIAAAVIQGAGFGALQPTALALAIDRATENSTGAAMSTVNVFLDFGFALGSFLVGTIAAYTDISLIYLGEAGVILLGMSLFLVLMGRERNQQQRKTPVPLLETS